jgi:ribosomal protein S6--L-glutamate ligase
MGVFCTNSSNGITNSRDKLRSLQILSRHHIGIPRTTFVRDRTDVLPAIHRVGGAPVIIKLLEGTQGVGVILADSEKIAEAIIETLQSTKQNVLVQKFVAESKGRDIRAFVVGDQVVAAMRRTAQGQEFRNNVHRGGQVEPVELDDQYRETAIRAAQIMGLRVAGVDMLEGKTGPQIMEVNSSPGLEGIAPRRPCCCTATWTSSRRWTAGMRISARGHRWCATGSSTVGAPPTTVMLRLRRSQRSAPSRRRGCRVAAA